MLLIINSGSSSIKFACYKQAALPEKIFYGQIHRIGLPDAEVIFHSLPSDKKEMLPVTVPDYADAVAWLTGWLEERLNFKEIVAIGHRVVHGMAHTEPSLITEELLSALKKIISYDPDHLPGEISLIEAFKKKHPEMAQFACFDTAFHQTMPRVAKLLAIPRRYDKMGIHRYGFHGLSYNYLVQELEKQAGKEEAAGRVILAHLGNGASLAAVFGGRSMDTSMGFTPAAGLPMSSRSGDLDPGVAWFIMKKENLSPDQFNHLITHDAGLLGISETSADMSDLLRQATTDERSAEAVDLFCYQVKKWIGSFAAALGGIDTLVFAGGVGENAPLIRERVCEGLAFLGIELDKKSNGENAGVISSGKGRVTVRVIHTDEEGMIARIVHRILTDKKSDR